MSAVTFLYAEEPVFTGQFHTPPEAKFWLEGVRRNADLPESSISDLPNIHSGNKNLSDEIAAV